jgi:hypothetical protein
MKKLRDFWSLHSYHLVAFWRNQIVMSILGISVGLATIALKNDAIAIVGCLFSVGLLCYLQYDNAFQLGLKDRYRPIDVKRPKRSLGLKIALLGSIPLAFITLLGLLFQLLSLDSPTVTTQLIYYAIHGSYIQTHALIKSADMFQTASLLNGVLNWGLCLAYTIPVVFFSTIGYLLGAADKPLRTFFGIKYKPDSHD